MGARGGMKQIIPHRTALIFRSLALFAALYQFRLIAKDMADTPVFAATLFAAFAIPAFLAALKIDSGKDGKKKSIMSLAALFVIGLVPWIARSFIAAPRLFISGRTDGLAINLDSLLLNLDRNNFVSLLPFYWAAITGWFAIRFRKFLRAALIADAVLVVVVYSIAHTAQIEMYRWPIVMITLFAGIVFLQALAMLFSLPPETRLRKKEIIPALAAILALIVFGGFLFLGPSRKQAVEQGGGGLLEPKFFSFDFSQVLKLDSEISMNDDLILIVKKSGGGDHILLRRSVMSGYNRKQGFYRIEELDEGTHPQRLPAQPVNFRPREFKASRKISQEYFLVNFDAAAFIGMNTPSSVTPYEAWDASSFSSAYMTESLVSGASFTDLVRSTLSQDKQQWPGAADLGLSENELKIYTDYGGDERLRAYAEEITAGLDRYSDKVRMIHNRLKFGEYRYSLKPGIAPDGDQLSFFLYQAKKGYCSYYAFAMTLLLRSLGIPARVAAGFFIDPETNTFDYYPVRSDMAHAWVEVPFPGYGWIEYDPTAEKLAEDEEFRFSSGVDPELFEKLMREILENRSRLKIKQGQEEAETPSQFDSITRSAIALLRNYWLPVLLVVLGVLFIFMRCGFFFAFLLKRDKRKRTMCLWRQAKQRLRLAGISRRISLSESEWALNIDQHINGIYALYQGFAAARFAPDYADNDFISHRQAYRDFSAAYGRYVSLPRRIIAWLLPPFALMLKARKAAALFIACIFISLASSQINAQYGEDKPFTEADELYMNATEAEYAEFWERAIELYKEGGVLYPDDPRFPWALGNLYFSRSLYGLAWDEYRKTEMLVPYSPAILIRLARTAGHLNQDQVSVEYYERVLEIEPEHKEAIGSLGWMYYKVHRLGDGEKLLTEALKYFGDDADLAMTLGTVYSDMYRYDEGKYWYNKAITEGESIGDRVFTAVAWYNLSILESHFYRYNFAMDATNASLNAQTRASGRLARGELYLRRLDLEQAQKDYEAAYETDTSPLAKLNLAQVYQISGRLEEARLYAEDCLLGSDLSWMLNYGIDPDRYKRDIHEILYKTYAGLAQAEKFIPWARPGEKVRSLLRSISYRFKHSVHRKLFQKYSLAAADAYNAEIFEDGGPHLDSFIQHYNAFETYPRRAIAYLNRARDFESSLIPAAEPSYNLEEGLLLKNYALLEKALAGFDPVWEKELISQAYKTFALRSGSSFAPVAAEELFALNRGAPRQAGIALPVQIHLGFAVNTGVSRRNEKLLEKALAKAGFKPAASARFSLNVRVNGSAEAGYSASCELVDSEGAGKTLRHSIPLRSFSHADVYDFARALGNAVFKVE